jgi:hypothetical protein
MPAARTVNFQHCHRKPPTHKALAVVNKGLNVWREMKVGVGGESRRLGQKSMGTVFCWGIHSPLKCSSKLREILTYGLLLILPCTCREMDNIDTDNSNSLYHEEHV